MIALIKLLILAFAIVVLVAMYMGRADYLASSEKVDVPQESNSVVAGIHTWGAYATRGLVILWNKTGL